MKPIKDVIEALRRDLPSDLQAQASVTLQCVAVEKSGSITFGVITSADLPGVPTHALTVHLGSATGANGVASVPPSAVASLPKPEGGDSLLELLTRIFGPPGFDNAARASVFREMIEELNSTQLEALLENLRNDRSEVPVKKHPDSTVAMTRQRILRLIKLGPAGLTGGIDAMLELFEQETAEVVLETIRAQWKTQEAWIDTSPPGVRLE